MPLERRVILRDAAGSSAGFEELRKNLITLSVTDAICKCASRNQPFSQKRRALPFRPLFESRPSFQKRASSTATRCVVTSPVTIAVFRNSTRSRR